MVHSQKSCETAPFLAVYCTPIVQATYSRVSFLNRDKYSMGSFNCKFTVTCFLTSSFSAQAVNRPSSHVVVSWIPVRLIHGYKTLNNCGEAACEFFCCSCCDDHGTCFLYCIFSSNTSSEFLCQLVSSNPRTAPKNASSNEKLPLYFMSGLSQANRASHAWLNPSLMHIISSVNTSVRSTASSRPSVIY